MRGSSAESFARISEQQARAIADGADAARLAENMFGAVDLFRTQPAFRRAASDSTTEPDTRAAMLREVFGGHVEPAALEVLVTAGSSRWAASSDLVESLERLGIGAVARAADHHGEGDRLERELFDLDNLVSEHTGLRQALTDSARSVADKQALLRSLLDDKACAGTVQLAERALTGAFSTSRRVFADYARVVTGARGRLLARVTVARPLEDAEVKRLTDLLSRQYGKAVHCNVVVDPATLGGVQVEIGNDVIDGTVSTRVSDAGRRLAG